MKILHEWHFHNRVCRVVESDPGIVHFEEATRTTGDPSIMLFNHTPTPMGAANEIIQLSMALAEANVINRDLSAAIQRWQEDRTARDQEIERLRAREKLWSEYVALMVESEKLTITMFHVHGGRFPVEMIERGKRLRYALGLE